MRRLLYRIAALMGWANAVSRGPGALGARVGRVYLLKAFTGLMNGLFRSGR